MKINFKKIILVILVLLMISVFLPNTIIQLNAKNKIFDDVTLIQKNKVGLVLGTGKFLNNGMINLYFTYRINATVELFNAKKIDFVLISGDNGNTGYDEPSDFKKALINKGIPENKLYLDYAGFRTLDSVVRAKEITIISQKFHNERAIYLAENKGIKAIGFNATDVYGRYGFKIKLREYLARTKVFIDIILSIQPKFLEKKIMIK